MKILVAVKRVVDANIKVRLKSDASGIELDNVKMAMNPFDEIAVEEAVRLKEAGKAEEVIIVSMGEMKCQETIRAALAMEADRGIHVHTDEELQPLAVAKLLKAVITSEQADLVIMGKQAIDDDSNQAGQMTAALLDWPQATFASELILEDAKLTVSREIDGGSQTISMGLPALVTTDLRLNEPRFAKLPSIMKAKKKPLSTITPDELGVDITPRLKRLGVEIPASRKEGIKVVDVSDLVDKLINEAKVL